MYFLTKSHSNAMRKVLLLRAQVIDQETEVWRLSTISPQLCKLVSGITRICTQTESGSRTELLTLLLYRDCVPGMLVLA